MLKKKSNTSCLWFSKFEIAWNPFQKEVLQELEKNIFNLIIDDFVLVDKIK